MTCYSNFICLLSQLMINYQSHFRFFNQHGNNCDFIFYLIAVMASVLTYCERLHLQKGIFTSIFGGNGATYLRVFIFFNSIGENITRLLNKLKLFEKINLFNNTIKNHFNNNYPLIDIIKRYLISFCCFIYIFKKIIRDGASGCINTYFCVNHYL